MSKNSFSYINKYIFLINIQLSFFILYINFRSHFYFNLKWKMIMKYWKKGKNYIQ